jgi:hypothetical protein
MLLILAVPSIAGTAPGKDAQKKAESWLALVDSAQYEASWEQASELFRSRIEKSQWVKIITSVRTSFEKLRSRKLKNASFMTSLPGAPDGRYVVLRFETSFKKKKSAEETVTTMEEGGQWKVSGYFIDSLFARKPLISILIVSHKLCWTP